MRCEGETGRRTRVSAYFRRARKTGHRGLPAMARRMPAGAYCAADAGFGAAAFEAGAAFAADLPAGLFVLSASSDFDS